MEKENPNVMIVEDEKLLLKAIDTKLRSRNMETVTCVSAEQAIDYLENMEEELPNVIWLDYHLPGMNGLEFVGRLKKNEKWSKIPIIVVSNSASEEKVHSMLALGVDKYLLKAEYRLDEIIETVKEIRNLNK